MNEWINFIYEGSGEDERERHTHTQRLRQTDKERDRDSDKERDRDSDRQRQEGSQPQHPYTHHFFSYVASRPQKKYKLLGTRSPGRPPRLSVPPPPPPPPAPHVNFIIPSSQTPFAANLSTIQTLRGHKHVNSFLPSGHKEPATTIIEWRPHDGKGLMQTRVYT